ncbi:MAG: hypothetical protein ISR55_09425 [Bacteroidetes bacterium]|nr:hypothetical protein [Bacteroidota bacterium]MBL6964034.1 hypothetical protein [Bacteroidota bacterium]
MLYELFTLVDNAYDLAFLSINDKHNKDTFPKAQQLELKINQLRADLIQTLMERINGNEISFESGLVYKDVISAMEKIGDYIFNIQESILNTNQTSYIIEY